MQTIGLLWPNLYGLTKKINVKETRYYISSKNRKWWTEILLPFIIIDDFIIYFLASIDFFQKHFHYIRSSPN